MVTDINARKEKLREEKLCYACLGLSHNQRPCKKKLYCHACKRPNSHHTALCFVTEKSSLVVKNENGVLLQTAN